MNWSHWIIRAGIGAMLSTAGWTAETRPLPEPPRPVRVCDPVCQLKAQDWAFSLLVETYREYRSNQIEADYQNRRLVIAKLSHLPDDVPVIHAQLRFVQELQKILGEAATADRGRELQLVHTQVANLLTAYACARKHDEQNLGVKVEPNLNPQRAARELKQYVASRPNLVTGNLSQVQPEPASAVLRDEPAVPADPNLLAEPCE
jgi:hypothetical protein